MIEMLLPWKGNHHKATEKYIEILLETIDKAPQELGYEFGQWSTKRSATYLEEVTGIKLSGSQVWRILSKKKVRLPLVKI